MNNNKTTYLAIGNKGTAAIMDINDTPDSQTWRTHDWDRIADEFIYEEKLDAGEMPEEIYKFNKDTRNFDLMPKPDDKKIIYTIVTCHTGEQPLNYINAFADKKAAICQMFTYMFDYIEGNLNIRSPHIDDLKRDVANGIHEGDGTVVINTTISNNSETWHIDANNNYRPYIQMHNERNDYSIYWAVDKCQYVPNDNATSTNKTYTLKAYSNGLLSYTTISASKQKIYGRIAEEMVATINGAGIPAALLAKHDDELMDVIFKIIEQPDACVKYTAYWYDHLTIRNYGNGSVHLQLMDNKGDYCTYIWRQE